MFHGWVRGFAEARNGLDALELGDGPFIGDISSVQSRFWFDQNDVNFFVGDGAMFDAARDNDEFTFAHRGFAIAEFHAQSAFDDQKELVFVVVMMPDKLAFEFNGFDVAVVDFADDARIAIVGEKAEFILEIDGVHGCT
jgi:hypothetical protein